MVAEMLNILGFHSSLKDEDLEKFYGRSKDREQEWKEEKFYNNIKEDTDLLLNLTERDCRTITKLKEELYQAQSFKPLLPDHKRKSLFEILDIQNYTDYLLMEFEEKKRRKETT